MLGLLLAACREGPLAPVDVVGDGAPIAPARRAPLADVPDAHAPEAAPDDESFPSEGDPLAPPWAAAPRAHSLSPEAVEGLYARSAATPAAAPDFLLACRFNASPGRAWDTGVAPIFTLGLVDESPPDLALALSINGGREDLRLGADNRARTHVAFPRVTLRPGDAVTARAFDRDVLRHDPMGAARAVWDGRWPLALSAPHFSLVCLPAPAEEVARTGERALSGFDGELARVTRSLGRAPTFTRGLYPETRFAGGRRRLTEAAAWLGWRHPATALRVARSNDLDRRLIAELRDALARASAVARGAARSSDAGAVTFQGIRCGLPLPAGPTSPPDCVALLTVTPRTSTAGDAALAHVVLYAAEARPRPLPRCWASRDRGATWTRRCALAAGETALLAFGGDEAMADVAPPSVLEVRLFFARAAQTFRVAP